MIKGKFPNGLDAAMKRVGIGQTELARLSKIFKQNVERHQKQTRRLTPEWAARYAPFLDCTAESLVFPASKAAKPPPAPRGKVVPVPLLSMVNAGKLFGTEGVTKANVRKTLLATGLPSGGDWIALEVEGDSMDRVAPAGSIIFVDRSDKRLTSGRCYVFSTEAGEATFKRFLNKPERLQPFSFNPDHETIYPQEDMAVLGRVRRVMLDL